MQNYCTNNNNNEKMNGATAKASSPTADYHHPPPMEQQLSDRDTDTVSALGTANTAMSKNHGHFWQLPISNSKQSLNIEQIPAKHHDPLNLSSKKPIGYSKQYYYTFDIDKNKKLN